MRNFILLSVMISFINCNHNQNKIHKQDTIQLPPFDHELLNRYQAFESSAMDSVNHYSLKSIYDSCLKYLYVLYGANTVHDDFTKYPFTIGECSIKLTRFIKDKENRAKLMFSVFVQDTIPAYGRIYLDHGYMPNMFNVNVETKEIISLAYSDQSSIKYSDVVQSYKEYMLCKEYSEYIIKYKNKLNFRYKTLLLK